MNLTEVICLDNSYSQLYLPFYEYVQQMALSTDDTSYLVSN
jgi:hypothetical protein